MNQSLDENLEEYTLTSRREILFYLHQLINDGERISVVFDEGRETLLTVLLHVNDEKGTLIFDWGGSETANRRLLNSERNFFICAPQGIRNQFITGRIVETTYKGSKAFATQIPAKYVRLQRRQFFRLVLPMTQRLQCTLPGAGEGQKMVFQAMDIGIGGIGIETPSANPPFELGQVIKGVEVDMKNFGVLTVEAEVRFVGTVQRGNKQAGRLGCLFVKLTPAQEHQLQKFITHVQREERARLGL